MADPYLKQALREVQVREVLEQLDHAAEQVSFLAFEIDPEDRMARNAIDTVETAVEQATAFVAGLLAEIKEEAA